MTPKLEFDGRKTVAGALVTAAVGLVACGIGLSVDPKRTLFSWLMAFVFVVSISLGGLILLMTTYVINAKWVVMVRRLNECVSLGVFPLAVLFLPLVLGAKKLYLWAEPPAALEEHALELLRHKQAYLNLPFFTARAYVYFAVFVTVAGLLRLWSLRRDGVQWEPGIDAASAQSRFRVFSSATLPLVALALTFAAFDWTMSLEPFWYSTLYGVYVFAGGFLAAISLVTVLAWLCQRTGAVREISGSHFYALGRLMFAFSIFWAYCGFFQAMLVQIANKPEEVPFYLKRSQYGWSYVMWTLIIGHFALPFALLLIRRIKFNGAVMAGVASWLLLMHLVDAYWLVLPVLTPNHVGLHWLDAAALAAVCGSCTAVVAWLQRGKSLLTTGDPFLRAAAKYGSA